MKKNGLALKVAGAVAAMGLVVGMIGVVQAAGAAIIPNAVTTPDNLSSNLVAWYKLGSLQTYGATVPDSSGNGHTATIGGVPSVVQASAAQQSAIYGGNVWCGSSDEDVVLPNNILRGLSSITITTNVGDYYAAGSPVEGSAPPYFLWGFGNPAMSSSGNGYLYATGAPTLHAGMTLTNWSGEQNATSSAPMKVDGILHRITYTYDAPSHTATLYQDGTQVAQNTKVTITPAQIGGGSTSQNLIGASEYSSDHPFDGCMNDFRIYNTALTATQVSSLVTNEAAAQTDASNLTVQDLNDVRGDLYLPTTLADGATVSWSSSNPAVITSSGLVTRQPMNTSVTLTADVDLAGGWAEATFTANVIAAAPAITPSNLAGYAFVYFTGDDGPGQNLYLAVSNGNNILNYSPVNNGKPILVSHFGTTGLRDPSLIRSPDGDTFYILATDLSIGHDGSGWGNASTSGSQYIEVWKSHNLVDWTQQAHTLVSLPTAGDTWAPDAIWDPTINQYVVYWATQPIGGAYHRMMYSTTRDFVNFSTPQVWQDPGWSRLDGAVTYDSANNTYYRFTKDEGTVPPYTGCSDILEESSTNLLTLTTPTSEGWTDVANCIWTSHHYGSNVEGPIIVHANPGDVNNPAGTTAASAPWYLFLDNFNGVGYVAMETADIAHPNWQEVTSGVQMPVPFSLTSTTTTRHGGILPITGSEMAQVKAGPTTQGIANYSKILQYNFAETGGTTIHDITGHGFNATAMNGATLGGGALTMDGSASDQQYALLPNNLMAGLTNMTIDADVWINPAQASPYMIYGLGYTGVTSGQGSGYLFATGDPVARAALSAADTSQEQSAAGGSALPRGQWVRLTYTVSHDWASHTTITDLYINGSLAKASINSASTSLSPGEIDLGYTPDDYIGQSLNASDNYFNGKIKSFTVWNCALTASQVAALGAP